MFEIKTSKEIPEIYHRLKTVFDIDWNDGVIIANGDTVHCKYEISPAKLVHESVHLKQQKKIGLSNWWEMYITMDSFRLEQEAEAYRKEYDFLKKNIKDREYAYRLKRELARQLASKQYGGIINFNDAITLLS